MYKVRTFTSSTTEKLLTNHIHVITFSYEFYLLAWHMPIHINADVLLYYMKAGKCITQLECAFSCN